MCVQANLSARYTAVSQNSAPVSLKMLRLASISLGLACLQLALNNGNGFACFGDVVAFCSFWLFWLFRFSGFISLFYVLVHAHFESISAIFP